MILSILITYKWSLDFFLLLSLFSIVWLRLNHKNETLPQVYNFELFTAGIRNFYHFFFYVPT